MAVMAQPVATHGVVAAAAAAAVVAIAVAVVVIDDAEHRSVIAILTGM